MTVLDLAPQTAGWEFVRAVEARAAEGRGPRGIEVETRALMYAGGDAAPWQATMPPLPAVPVRRRRMIGNLIRRVPVGVGLVPYVREVSAASGEGQAAATGEGSAKAEVEMSFELDEELVGKVTAWVPATDELLDDAPGLAAYVDGRLTYLTHVREEYELLDGTGAPGLEGIRTVSGVQSQAFSTSVAETIAKAIELVQLADGTASAVVIHPTPYRVSRLAAPAFWEDVKSEIEVVVTRAAGADKAVVGDFATAAAIRERSSVVRYGPQHDDYFVKNKTAIVGELREAAIWHVPSHFVKAALA